MSTQPPLDNQIIRPEVVEKIACKNKIIWLVFLKERIVHHDSDDSNKYCQSNRFNVIGFLPNLQFLLNLSDCFHNSNVI